MKMRSVSLTFVSFLYLLCLLCSCCWCAGLIETGCEAEFEGRCKCGKVRLNGVERYVTNCTDSGFNDVSVLKQLPIETEILIFTGNNIRILPPNVFGDEGKYDRLVKIDFSRNNITEIQGQAFHRVPKVGVLVLDDNRWKVDGEHTRIFANMPLLEELHLDRGLSRDDLFSDGGDGGIQTLVQLFRDIPVRHLTKVFLRGNQLGPFFKMDVFCDVPSLSEIYLSDNGIVHLLWNSSCLKSLHTLDLSRNMIEFLPNSTMDNLDVIGDVTVDLSDNNFDCDCNMIPFYAWLHETDVHVMNKEGYTCKDGFPESNTGALILTVQANSLRCHVMVLLEPHFGFVHVVLLLIIVLISSVLLIVAVAHRHAIVDTFRNVGGPVYRRMQYSTIRKDGTEQELEI